MYKGNILVKHFSEQYGIDNIINTWLLDNQEKIDVIDIKFSSSVAADSRGEVTMNSEALIIYKLKIIS